MHLSNAQTLLLHFFLINSLTLLLKPYANAQSVSPVNVFAYNDHRHNRPLLNEPEEDYIYIWTSKDRPDGGPADAQALSSFDFRGTLKNLSLKPSVYQVIKNNSKIYMAHKVVLIPIYSIDLRHSTRLTFKLFKLVIVPFWRSK